MKIRKMSASFGVLEKRELELAPGLNVLQAGNEGGKSTWAAFLRVMLYGIDTKDRDKKDHIADKNRYRPWSGLPMEGVLECEHRGRVITLRRYTRGAVPMGVFEAVYSDTGEPVEGMTGENCGELLVGVGREAFERSAFLRQSGLSVSQAPELERRIAALVTTGEEEVSFSQTEGRLREWLRRRKFNSSGQIPRLEGELRQVEDTLTRMDRATQRITAARGELEQLEKERIGLEADLHIHRRLAQRELNRRYAQAKEELDRARAALSELEREQEKFGSLPEREQLKQAQGELSYLKVLDDEIRQGEQALGQANQVYSVARARAEDEHFPNMTGEEAAEKARTDRTAAETLLTRAETLERQRPLMLLPGLALGGCLVLAGWLLKGSLFPFLWGGLGLFGALGVILLLCWNHRTKAVTARAEHILARYDAKEPAELTGLAADYRRREEEARRAGEDAARIRTALAERMARRENGQGDVLAFVRGFSPEVSDRFGCSAALSRALGLEERRRLAQTRLEGARRLAEELEAQGGREYDTLEMLYPPKQSPEETAARLGAVDAEWKRISAELAMATGEQQTLGDLARLQARREQLREQLEELRLEYGAIEQALDALRSANDRLQARFSPELNALAGGWMSRLTGGKYEKVTLDRELRATAEQGGELVPRPVLVLSQGTADQLYLAVRLAICQLVLPGEEPCPIVLDDALANFDDGRMALALDCLTELARERQILLLTCHSREGAYLSGREGVCVQRLQS